MDQQLNSDNLSLVGRQFAGHLGRRLGLLCCRCGIIGVVMVCTSIFVIGMVITSTSSYSGLGPEADDDAAERGRLSDFSAEQRRLVATESKTVTTTTTEEPTTTTTEYVPSTTPPPVPKMAKVNFRLINHFDSAATFLKIPNEVVTNPGPILPVTRFGKFSATLRNKELVMLIPTIHRPKESYLLQTIHSLLENMSPDDKKRLVILVSINEISNKSANSIFATANRLINEFENEVLSGLIEIIAAPPEFYMDLTSFPDVQDPAIEDTPARLRWRSKQVIDYAFMFSYAFTQKMASYLLLLEDDVIVTESRYIDSMLTFPEHVKQNENPAITLWYEFCPWGAIGKMFPSKYVPTFVNIMTTIYYIEPVDWQLGHIAELFGCRYFHSKQQCDTLRKKYFKVFPRKLFKHVAKVSTAPEQPTRRIPKAT